MIIAVTESNNVYALDATTGLPIWSRTDIGPPVPTTPCGGFNPTGITGTPVVDLASRRLFFDALINGSPTKHFIYSLNLDTGATTAGWPVDLNATVIYNGITFISLGAGTTRWTRAGERDVYSSYSGYVGDCGNYHGWVVGVDINNPTNVHGWATTAMGGGIWGHGGVASDGTNMFVVTGNTFNTGGNWMGGEAIIRLQAGPTWTGQPTDYWAPTNWFSLDNSDTDLGGVSATIGIALIEPEPIRRRPVVGRLTRPCRSRLQTDNGFTAHPVAACIEGVPCDDKHVCAIAGNAAVAPNTAAHGCCSPAMHIGRVVDVHADNPAMIIAAVAHVAGVGRVYDPVHQRESTALFLRQRNEWNSVVNDGGVQVHRPTRSGGAGVQVQRINEMFCGGAVNQCVEEKPTRGEIDNRSACDTSGKKTSARGVWDGRTNIGARPDREACCGIKGINVIRFGDGNNHRPIRATFDVKRLGVNIT